MPYRKQTRKQFPKKRVYKKKPAAFSYTGAAMKALKMAVKLRGIINSEKKFRNANLLNTAITTTASVALVTNIAQGDTESNRNGNSVLLKSIELKGNIGYAAASGTITDLFLIEDKKAVNGTAPSFGEVFVGSPASVALWRNMDFDQRFVIKWQKQFIQHSEIDMVPINETIYLGDNHHCKWYGTNGSDTESGHYYLMAVSNISTNSPVLYLDKRIRYYDN